MAKIIQRKRHIDGDYAKCKECGNTVEVNKPLHLDMPYCGDCGMIVYDANQKFCAWCGEKFSN